MGVVPLLAALAHVQQLGTLDLNLLKTLSEHRVRTERVAVRHLGAADAVRGDVAGVCESLSWVVAAGDDPDAAGQQRHRGARLRAVIDQVAVQAGSAQTRFCLTQPGLEFERRAVMRPFDRRGEGDRRPRYVCDRQLFLPGSADNVKLVSSFFRSAARRSQLRPVFRLLASTLASNWVPLYPLNTNLPPYETASTL